MFGSLLALIESRGIALSCIDFLLPRLVSHFREDFITFADCGAGIGHTASRYYSILKSELDEQTLARSRIYAYEPLPENYSQLIGRLGKSSVFRPKQAAVSNFSGEAKFVVPARMQGGAPAAWGQGTSAIGYLGSSGSMESVSVNVVKMEDEPFSQCDFIKLDLQGGEKAALQGLGEKLGRTKVVYAEHQLLGDQNRQPQDFLSRNGFICYYDKLQFGIKDAAEVPVKLLRDGGISISRIKLPDGRGLPLILWGSLEFGGRSRMTSDGTFDSGYIQELKDAGVYYLQTDVVALNKDLHSEITRLF